MEIKENYKRKSNTICEVCGKSFYKRPCALISDKSHCCSHSCQNNLRTSRMRGEGNHQFGLKGSLNSSFKSDWRVSTYNYLEVRVQNHPLSRSDGFMFAHRLVVEEYLKLNDPGSPYLITIDDVLVLSPDFVIHHKDENRLNNVIENLEIMSLGDHQKHHQESAEYERNWDGTFKTIYYKKVGGGRLTRSHIDDAGLDLTSSCTIEIPARSSCVVGTDTSLSIPKGFVGFLWSRSGLSAKHNIEVGAGCIDSGFLGEIRVILYNHSDKDYLVCEGDKIAQLITVPISLHSYSESKELETTDRGDNGFGSTGV